MKKNILTGVMIVLILTGAVGLCQASLIQIGMAYYNDGSSNTGAYNLIYDDVQQITWLDYTHERTNYEDQVSWAESLNEPGELNIMFFQGFSMTWTGEWRLPETVDGPFENGYDGTTTCGYNITSSEMGYLFHTALGNLSYMGPDATPQDGSGLINKGSFINLTSHQYWSGTPSGYVTDSAWTFAFGVGYQGYVQTDVYFYGIAVCSGYLSTPLPGGFCLLCAGLISLVGIKRKNNS